MTDDIKKGWIALHRKIIDSDLWNEEPFTRGQAWIDLILLTNHKDGYIRVRGNRVKLKRGQCGWSILRLSKRWKWSRGKTQRFMDELKNDGRISIKTDTKTSITTICNYSHFQDRRTTDSTTDSTTDGQQTDNRQDTNNNDNNDNKLKEKNIKKRKAKFKRPENVEKQIWNDFCEMRKVKKAPITKTVISKIENEAFKINWDLQKAIEHMVLRNWQGFNHKWILNERQRDNHGKQSKLDQAKQSAIDWLDGH